MLLSILIISSIKNNIYVYMYMYNCMYIISMCIISKIILNKYYIYLHLTLTNN